MTDPRPHQPFADLLLEQETQVSEAQLGEYRRKLERRLARAAQHERRMRAATFGTATVVLLGAFYFLVAASLSPPGVFPLQHVFHLFPEPVGVIVGIAIWTCYLTCALCVVPFLLLYSLQYRRKLQQAQQEQVLDILGALQRQIDELREQGRPTAKEPGTAGFPLATSEATAHATGAEPPAAARGIVEE